MWKLDLELCEGPECPRCHIPDAVILRQPTEPADIDPDGVGVWFSDGRAWCELCRLEFSFRAAPVDAGASSPGNPR